MAKIPISKLPQATSVAANNELPIVQSGVTKKALIEDVGKEVNTTQQYSDLNTTDKIPIGAINEVNAKVEDKADASSLAKVATSGSYNDLTDKPTIPEQMQSDWNEEDNTKADYIKNKPNLSTVATSGNYNDLSNKPTIPAAQVNSDWNANSGVSQILNKPNLSTVATSGDYNDLNNKPSVAVIDDTQASASKVYSSNKVEAIAEKKIDKDANVSKNFYDTSWALNNKYIDYSSSAIENSSQGILSGYVPVEESKTYTIYNGNNLLIFALCFFKVSNGRKMRVCACANEDLRYYGTSSTHWPEITGFVTAERVGNAITFTVLEGSEIEYACWYISKESSGYTTQYYGVHTDSEFAEVTSKIQINEGNILQPFDKPIGFENAVEKLVFDKNCEENFNPNRLFGKVLVTCGDSITEGTDMDSEGITDNPSTPYYLWSTVYQEFRKQVKNVKKTYGYQIAERNKMIFYNAGVGGSTMQGIAEKEGFSLADGRYTKLPDNIDYLLIWFGWNDTAYGTLGTINDNTNESYYGGYNVVLPYLINKYPYTKIALIVPFGTDENHRNAIRELGDKWGLAVWDNYKGGTPLYYGKEASVGVDASIVTSNQAKFQANGAHPNFKGHRQLADMIEHFLRGI